MRHEWDVKGVRSKAIEFVREIRAIFADVARGPRAGDAGSGPLVAGIYLDRRWCCASKHFESKSCIGLQVG